MTPTDPPIEVLNAAITLIEAAKRERRQGNLGLARHDAKAAIDLLVRFLFETGDSRDFEMTVKDRRHDVARVDLKGAIDSLIRVIYQNGEMA